MVWHILAQAAVKFVARKFIAEVMPEEYCDHCGSQKKKKWFANRMSYICETCIDPALVKTVGNEIKVAELAVSNVFEPSMINMANQHDSLIFSNNPSTKIWCTSDTASDHVNWQIRWQRLRLGARARVSSF
jgi:hypothetical protein